MSNKTSHRRKHLKERDPMALALEEPIFHQRRVERKRYVPTEKDYDEEND